jgi:hypothetical protein
MNLSKLNQCGRKMFILFGIILTSLNTMALTGGGDGSGGGGRIEALFRSRAYSMISKIAKTPEADSLCPAAIIRSSFEKTKIRIVTQLTNPATGKPIDEVGLDAWTVPGDMQLLGSSWSANFAGAYYTDSGITTLILHEIYRSTGGICDDENFKISAAVADLIAFN